MAKKDAKPNKAFTAITQTGLKAHALALEHRKPIEARLPAGLIDGLAHDLGLLGAAVPGATQARAGSKSATATQDAALEAAHLRVSAIRLAVQRSDEPADVKRHWGVGTRYNARVVKDVRAAAKTILDRAHAHAAEARAVGIIPRALRDLEAAAAAVESADAKQEKARAHAPDATRARNIVARRIVGATDRIATAGVLELAADAGERARFEALIGAGNTKRSAKAGGAAPPAASTPPKPPGP